MNDGIDPIEAFFSGLGSGFSRALVGVLAVVAGYAANSWANTAHSGGEGLNPMPQVSVSLPFVFV